MTPSEVTAIRSFLELRIGAPIHLTADGGLDPQDSVEIRSHLLALGLRNFRLEYDPYRRYLNIVGEEPGTKPYLETDDR